MEPKATNKHTLCGYAWGDVVNSLVKAIGAGDMVRSQRWAAELVCSEQGLGKLEAALVHAWATHVATNNPAWCMSWVHSATHIRALGHEVANQQRRYEIHHRCGITWRKPSQVWFYRKNANCQNFLRLTIVSVMPRRCVPDFGRDRAWWTS